MQLPVLFCERMKMMLKEEYAPFLAEYQKPHLRGIRLNPLKCTMETLRESLPFSISPSPFSPLSCYAPEEKVGALPAHHAGMFYAQEPSASSAVTVLAPEPGERVLDLCAAPGGKSTQIASLMEGRGLLWSNEIVRQRAGILLSNLERMGVRNAVVSSCHPQRLCEGLRGCFDRVLVDAPCSGEGMFRRDEAAVAAWSPEHVKACAVRQASILDSAALAVREGGILVYSTCTFSLEENEGAVTAFLERHPEFQLEPVSCGFGRPAYGMPALRIFPMDGGEGHFVAKLRRTGENPSRVSEYLPPKAGPEEKEARALYESLFSTPCFGTPQKAGERIILLPAGLPAFSGLGVLRAGVELGECRGKRIEPAHGLFLAQDGAECRRKLTFEPEHPSLLAFLRGEEIECGENGYTAVCVNGVVTGFGKASGGRLKNRYPKGLRNH